MTSVKYPSCMAEINEKGPAWPMASLSLTRLQVMRYNPSQINDIVSAGQLLQEVCGERERERGRLHIKGLKLKSRLVFN